jgi:glutamate-5-semialdehyde dehydrogenase
MDLNEMIRIMARDAKASARDLRAAKRGEKDNALELMAENILSKKDEIIKTNNKDITSARKKGLTPAMIDRLTLNEKTITSMAAGLREVAALPDPVGEVTGMWKRPNGLQVGRVRIPLGVIGFIYESRPNVTVDAAALCLKSGNAVLLKGGSEAINSNLSLNEILADAVKKANLPEKSIQVIPSTEHEAVGILLGMDEYVDMIIPRGGEGLISFVVENSRVPVLKCNAMETMLVHKKVAPSFLPGMIEAFKNAGVEIRACRDTIRLVPGLRLAEDKDWPAEFLDLILAVKIVRDMDEALDFIDRYGSNHTEAIVTNDYERSKEFLEKVDMGQ